jgi:putative colanic acid biosynthesis UDP-glucose lipid carrier transferase
MTLRLDPATRVAGPRARGRADRRRSALAQRLFDLLVAAGVLALLAVPMLALAAAIRLSDGGPALYRQWRAGRDGKPFALIKFRTMHPQACRDCPDRPPVQACPGDPRVTPLGRVLRRCSLDELPQLLNVLRGEMALVGPRPHALAQDALWAAQVPGYALRRAVKPGLTGWAQVHGLRGPADTRAKLAARVAYDRDYLARGSLALDLWILLRTVPVLVHPNAC